MAWTYDTKAAIAERTTQYSAAYTCAVGCGVLVVGITVTGATPRTATAPTYGGLTLTQVGTATFAGEGGTEMWYLLNPPSGANTLVVPDGNGMSIVIVASSYKVPDGKGGAYDTTNTNSNAGSTNPTVSVTPTTTASILIDSMFSGYLNITTTPLAVGQGVELNRLDTGSEVCGAHYLISSSTSPVTMSWTQALDDWVTKAVVFKEVAGAWTEAGTGSLAITATAAIGLTEYVASEAGAVAFALTATAAIGLTEYVATEAGTGEFALTATAAIGLTEYVATEAGAGEFALTATCDAVVAAGAQTYPEAGADAFALTATADEQVRKSVV